MSWAVLSQVGRISSLHTREASAVTNARGRVVVEAPAEVTARARDWRFTEASGWVLDPQADPSDVRFEALNRDGRRRDAYSREDRDLMLEVALEVALALAADPVLAERLRSTTLAKVEALNDRIAAVKAQHP